MGKNVSEKEKLLTKAVKMVERLVADGETVSRARNFAALKFGFSYPTMQKHTMHLSPRANKQQAAAE